ncbi:hypothetical protein QOZ80_2BG0194170 [Eleusine coracana subsp. coracana]|nr:hypothetical protein QOZ80_2BG0194170 [Eleusine coracana subsp. coracana]
MQSPLHVTTLLARACLSALLLMPQLSCMTAQPTAAPGGNSSALAADELALLSFKAALSDPAGSLASWNASNRLCSTWRGVTCGSGRVVALRLDSLGLVGPVSPFLGNLSFLTTLDLGNNRLVGHIPPQLGRLIRLQLLNLSANSLNGDIPSALGMCTGLATLLLSSNRLHGGIPGEVGALKNLIYLNLESNRLSGQIPASVGNLSSIQELRLANNTLSGAIPPSLGQLPNLSSFILYYNNLSGSIPETLWNISSLTRLNVYENDLTGEIPSDVFDRIPRLRSLFLSLNRFHGRIPSSISNASNLVTFQGAVKSFVAECDAMKNIRHRNLVRIITACSSIDSKGGDFKAIVFEYMPNGSLEHWLHPRASDQLAERKLNLPQRVDILFDVAYALDYLHLHGLAPIVHCDLKPSNVLLDTNMVAHVGDFGLARILSEGCTSFQMATNSAGFRGTIGYAPPEYGAGNIVSTHGDMYSYGILVLEMLTGRRPTDNAFDSSLGLRNYVETALNNNVMDIIDMKLLTEVENNHHTTMRDPSSIITRVDSLISLLKLGLVCSVETPSSRMTTKEIIKELHVIKNALANREQGS